MALSYDAIDFTYFARKKNAISSRLTFLSVFLIKQNCYINNYKRIKNMKKRFGNQELYKTNVVCIDLHSVIF